ncbi:hypothetical protein FE257_006674 [Aspergillus nanangensis]|uniref:Rhodopsin domain-containing protein n=1 Tax=Aspergillus nanangensis TaxID=2582783 RepID=A0AAD4GTW2_ASPNN|nr:hypothetical protein FE257_006674 [Aspergillus nanangensis]
MSYIAASNGSRQPMFLAVMGLLLLLSCISVCLRLYCRVFRVHKLGNDDFLIVAALAVAIGMGIMNGVHISYGTGRHFTDLPLQEILIPTLKHWYVYQLIYPISIGLVKFSILAQYYRIFEVRKFRILVVSVAVFVLLYTIITIFVNAFECRSKPWRAWDPSFPTGCNNLPATYFSTAGINILTDLIILVMPLPLLMRLNLNPKRRWALVGIFLTGTFASAASIVRLNALYIYTVTKDVSYDAIYILLWSQIEVNVAIISASAPSLRPLFSSVFRGSSHSRGRAVSSIPYGAYGTNGSNYRRTTIKTNAHGAIELSSRDDENLRDVSRSRERVGDDNSVRGLITGDGVNIVKTVVIETKREDRR